MKKRFNIHRIIEEQDLEKKNELYQKLEERLDLSDKKTEEVKAPKKSFLKNWRYYAAAAVTCCIICVAVLVPILLNAPSQDSETNLYRYCDTKDYNANNISDNIKQYATLQQKDLLYFDWYNNAEIVETTLYTNKKDSNDMICIQEMIVNGETGEKVLLFITDIYTRVDLLKWMESSCVDTSQVNSIEVKWTYGETVSNAIFEFNGFRYYIELEFPEDENSILTLIETLL